jgi:hypothetical protein
MSYANNDFGGMFYFQQQSHSTHSLLTLGDRRGDNINNPSYDNTTGTGNFDRRDDLGASRQDRVGGQDRFSDNVTGTGNYDSNYGSSGTGVGPGQGTFGSSHEHGVRDADRFDNSGSGVQDRFTKERAEHGVGLTGVGSTDRHGNADRLDNTGSNFGSGGVTGDRHHGEHNRLGEHNRTGDDFRGDNSYGSTGATGGQYDNSRVDNFGRNDTHADNTGTGYGADTTGHKPTMGEKIKGMSKFFMRAIFLQILMCRI